LGLLLAALGGAVGGTHSLRYYYTGVTEPGPGLPRFVVVGYVDGEAAGYYNSDTEQTEPTAAWIEAKTDQLFWYRQTQVAQVHEQRFHADLDTLQKRYNQSGGSHTLQRTFGCDVFEDGAIRGFYQY
ncbi:HA1F protein, partial [Penelope pileata]|nr:HA1F protein [Penelope pileata]